MSAQLSIDAFDIAVVIPTYERAELLPALLDCLKAQTLAPDRFEVVLVDDCSTVDPRSAVEAQGEFPFRLRVLRTSRNDGPARARNIGWRATNAPILAFTDDDCLPAPEWLEAGLAAMTARPRIGVLQARTSVPDGVSIDGLEDWYIWRIVEKPEPEFMACNVFFRRSALEATGGFDEKIGWWGEDTAAGWRVIDAGWDRSYSDEALVIHPVQRRGFGFFVSTAWREHNLVRLGVDHPGYRADMYWRPWAYRVEGPQLVAALMGLALSRKHRSALLLALPYWWHRHPSIRRKSFFRLSWQFPIVDAVRVLAHLRGSIEQRTFVL